jgi:hypothetical protein
MQRSGPKGMMRRGVVLAGDAVLGCVDLECQVLRHRSGVDETAGEERELPSTDLLYIRPASHAVTGARRGDMRQPEVAAWADSDIGFDQDVEDTSVGWPKP